MQLLEGFCSWPWKLCSRHVPHCGGFPRPCGGVGFAPCCPWGRFCEQCEAPQPLHTKAIQFIMCYLLTRWRLGQWQREEAGEGKGLLGLCWQHRGGALSQLLFVHLVRGARWGCLAPAGSVPSLSSIGSHPLRRVLLCHCAPSSASSRGGLKTPETCCPYESPVPPRW